MPRNVDFFHYPEDFQTALLGALGFSTAYIIQQTRLTEGQIVYRLAKAKVRRTDYRSGDSVYAQQALRAAKAVVGNKLQTALPRAKVLRLRKRA